MVRTDAPASGMGSRGGAVAGGLGGGCKGADDRVSGSGGVVETVNTYCPDCDRATECLRYGRGTNAVAMKWKCTVCDMIFQR